MSKARATPYNPGHHSTDTYVHQKDALRAMFSIVLAPLLRASCCGSRLQLTPSLLQPVTCCALFRALPMLGS